MSFFTKILDAIGGLFKAKAVASTVSSQVDAKTTAATTTTSVTPADIDPADVQKAIDLVNNVKNALASPVAVLITDIIPGNIDDAIRQTLVADLPVVAAGLTFFKDALSGDKSTALSQVLANIKFSDKPNIDAFCHTLAAKVLMIISGGSISWSKAVMAVEYVLKESLFNGIDTAAASEVLNNVTSASSFVAPAVTA